MDCMEIDMEQNEQKEDKGFESLDNQSKHESLHRDLYKKANLFARVSQVFLGLAAFFVFVAGYFVIANGNEKQEVISEMIIFMTIGFYFFSLIFAIKGFMIKKTSLTKLMLVSDFLIPIYVIGGILLILYIIWGVFGGFASEKTTFIEFILGLFS